MSTAQILANELTGKTESSFPQDPDSNKNYPSNQETTLSDALGLRMGLTEWIKSVVPLCSVTSLCSSLSSDT